MKACSRGVEKVVDFESRGRSIGACGAVHKVTLLLAWLPGAAAVFASGLPAPLPSGHGQSTSTGTAPGGPCDRYSSRRAATVPDALRERRDGEHFHGLPEADQVSFGKQALALPGFAAGYGQA